MSAYGEWRAAGKATLVLRLRRGDRPGKTAKTPVHSQLGSHRGAGFRIVQSEIEREPPDGPGQTHLVGTITEGANKGHRVETSSRLPTSDSTDRKRHRRQHDHPREVRAARQRSGRPESVPSATLRDAAVQRFRATVALETARPLFRPVAS